MRKEVTATTQAAWNYERGLQNTETRSQGPWPCARKIRYLSWRLWRGFYFKQERDMIGFMLSEETSCDPLEKRLGKWNSKKRKKAIIVIQVKDNGDWDHTCHLSVFLHNMILLRNSSNISQSCEGSSHKLFLLAGTHALSHFLQPVPISF